MASAPSPRRKQTKEGGGQDRRRSRGRELEGDGPGAVSVSPRIPIPEKEIADFCRRRHIVSFALFGSVLRDDFRPDSDVDVLVEFEPDHIPGLAFFGMQ